MAGEKSLKKLIQTLRPKLNPGEYVFTTQQTLDGITVKDCVGQFIESEGTTLIMERKKADSLRLSYEFIASWITLTVHSSLDAVGLTAIFSSALAKNGIGCNIVSAYFHDHIFVNKKDCKNAIRVLTKLSENYEGT